MSNLNISNRYASALMELAHERKMFEETAKDVELVYNTIKNSRQLKIMLESPVVKRNIKFSVLKEIFENKISKESLDFLHFIVNKNREELLFDILFRFLVQRDKKLGIVNVEVSSPAEFLDDHKHKLIKKLEEYTGKKVRITFSLDKQLIGGFLVRVEDTIIDTSLKNQLERLKTRFLKGNSTLSA